MKSLLPLCSGVPNDTAKRLLERVKQFRKSRELSQEAFAEKAGLGYKYYQSIEAGRKRDIRLSTLEKLAKGCGWKLTELLDLDAPPMVLAEEPAKFSHKAQAGARRLAKRTGQ